MFQDILRLSRQTLTYGLGTVLTRLVAFLLLPFFTHQLSPDRFAIYVLFYMAIALLIELMRLGLDIALLRFYVPEQDPARRRLIFSTAFWAALAFASVFAAAICLGAGILVKLVVASPLHPPWMIYTLKLCALVLWLDAVSAFPLVVMRGENRAVQFTAIRLAGAVAQVAFTILFLVAMKRGVAGIFEANALSSALVLILCLPTLLGRLRGAFDRPLLKGFLAFGLPTIPTVLFAQLVVLADRKILELLRTPAEMGLYSAGYRLGTFMAIVAVAFRFAWQPFFLQISTRPDARQVYARVLTYFLAAMGWIYLLLTAYVIPLAKWDIPGMGPLIDPEYWPGLAVFPVILLAYVFDGCLAVFMVGVYIEKKTALLPLITGAAAAVNIVGNIILVPIWGMWASAWLTVLAYAIMAASLYIYINRYYPISYEWGRVLHVAVAAAAIFAVGAVGERCGTHLPAYILSVLFPLLLLVTRLANRGELQRLGLFGGEHADWNHRT